MTKPPQNANAGLRTLFGEGHADATRTRECVAMPGMRRQEVLTPYGILWALHELWPEGIALDPCAPQAGSPWAERCYTGDPLSGLKEPWADRTYCNPPYGTLSEWLCKGEEEAEKGHEVAMLVPMRTHRKWFDLGRWPEVCFLWPVTFAGFDQAFPAPLVLLYSGSRDLRAAFGGLGRCAVVVTESDRQGVLL